MTTITALVTGQRHRIERYDVDRRVGWTRCGERMAFGSRAMCVARGCPIHPPAPKTTDCAECWS